MSIANPVVALLLSLVLALQSFWGLAPGQSRPNGAAEQADAPIPQATEAAVAEARLVGDEVDRLVAQTFGENPTEDSLAYVEQLLLDTPEAANVQMADGAVLYTVDGVACIYALPPAEDTYGFGDTGDTEAAPSPQNGAFPVPPNTAVANTPLAQAATSGLSGADLGHLYAYNTLSITNSNVLFSQSFDDLTLTDYHEALCEQVARLNGGTFAMRKGGTGLYTALTDGTTLADFGFVVINAHGNASNFAPRSDGSWRGWLVAMEVDEHWQFDRLASQALYEDPSTGAEALLRLGTDGSVYVSTDYIMECYADATFDNAVFYLAVCNLMQDQAFCRFLLDRGVQAIVGSPYELYNFVDRDYCQRLQTLLTTPYGLTTLTLPEAMASIDHELLGMTLVCRTPGYVLWGAGEITGMAADIGGAPVAGASVRALRYLNHEFIELAAAQTDANGRFAFGELLPCSPGVPTCSRYRRPTTPPAPPAPR